jgi:hypothetical protein
MGNTIDQKINLNNNSVDNLVNTSTLTCSANCVATNTGNTFIITGKTGNINIDATCTADANCMMSAAVQTTVEQTLSNAVGQEAKMVTDLFNDFASSKIDNTQDITNSMINNTTQITEIACQSSATTTVSNNFVYVKGQTGNINLDANGSANSSCTMKNLAKIQTHSKISNNLLQKDKKIGMFAIIFIALISIVMIGGIIFVLLISTGVLKGMTSGGGGGKNDFNKMDMGANSKQDEALKLEEELQGEEGGVAGLGGLLGEAEEGAGGLGGLVGEAEGLI